MTEEEEERGHFKNNMILGKHWGSGGYTPAPSPAKVAKPNGSFQRHGGTLVKLSELFIKSVLTYHRKNNTHTKTEKEE